MTDPYVATSKLLSYWLRHAPADGGLVLSRDGWAPVPDVLAALETAGRPTGADELADLVATNDKRRFELAGDRIRAVQGHSIEVDLRLEPQRPPDLLFHGTVERFLTSIRQDGLRPGSRQHVPLSADEATARTVGARRGVPVVLEVDAAAMQAAGMQFYRARNGVWLTGWVPPEYLR